MHRRELSTVGGRNAPTIIPGPCQCVPHPEFDFDVCCKGYGYLRYVTVFPLTSARLRRLRGPLTSRDAVTCGMSLCPTPQFDFPVTPVTSRDAVTCAVSLCPTQEFDFPVTPVTSRDAVTALCHCVLHHSLTSLLLRLLQEIRLLALCQCVPTNQRSIWMFERYSYFKRCCHLRCVNVFPLTSVLFRCLRGTVTSRDAVTCAVSMCSH